MGFRNFHPNIKIRLAVMFVTNIVSSMVLPLMAIYYARKLGEGITGVLLVFNVAVGFAAGFFGGYFSDRKGRKRYMVGAEAVMVILYIIAALVNSSWFVSPWITYLAMVGISICSGFFGPASDAMLLDVSMPEERKTIYSMQYWLNNLSSAFGGMIGAFLFEQYLFQLFLGLAVVGLFSVMVTMIFIKDTYKGTAEITAAGEGEKTSTVIRLLRNYREVLKDRPFVWFVIAVLLTVSVEFHLGSYISIRLSEEMPLQSLFGWLGFPHAFTGIQAVGLLRTENTMLVVLLTLFVMKLLRRFDDKQVMLTGVALYITSYSIVAYTNHLPLLVLCMLIATWGEVMYVPVIQAYLGIIARADARSSYMAVYGFTFRGATIVSSLAVIIGSVLPSWSMASGIFACGFAGVLILLRILPALDRRKMTAG
ncbi:DHA1 family multidrug resistance protein B-like MFS transporter [Fontibacillus solani]|uniref:DHA1 family multidrug resistance protein B-like MFS transporter n=1 Tax=Fontibacillus solani TaxID=1572857 RepID=A0A7W3SVC2_9BACL|nr:MFS transporter [Fontibacillus solani]MBA9086874.1 DHA1 family multidrug resistance protein B-like MFS transporter [Fontibacillus solani]